MGVEPSCQILGPLPFCGQPADFPDLLLGELGSMAVEPTVEVRGIPLATPLAFPVIDVVLVRAEE